MIEGDKRQGIQSRGTKMFNGIIAVIGDTCIMIGYDKNFQTCCNGLSYTLSYMMAIFTLMNYGTIKIL